VSTKKTAKRKMGKADELVVLKAELARTQEFLNNARLQISKAQAYETYLSLRLDELRRNA
jgi:hypothetical protein